MSTAVLQTLKAMHYSSCEFHMCTKKCTLKVYYPNQTNDFILNIGWWPWNIVWTTRRNNLEFVDNIIVIIGLFTDDLHYQN